MKGSSIKRLFKQKKMQVYTEPYMYSSLEYNHCKSERGSYGWESYKISYTDGKEDEEEDDVTVKFTPTNPTLFNREICFEKLKDLRKHVEVT